MYIIIIIIIIVVIIIFITKNFITRRCELTLITARLIVSQSANSVSKVLILALHLVQTGSNLLQLGEIISLTSLVFTQTSLQIGNISSNYWYSTEFLNNAT